MAAIFQQVSRWDARVSLRISEGARSRWKFFFFLLSRSADFSSCLLLGLAWALLAPGARGTLACALPSFALELFLYYLVKKNIRRPRPFRKVRDVRALIAVPDEFSFPSGHTAAAFLMAALLASAFPFLALPALLWASLVGFSRIYLGVHYPTDVLAGMLLGLASAHFGLDLAGWVH